MNDITVARRYARALYEEAEHRGHTARVDEDVDLIRESIDASRELMLFFRSPIISRERKERVVRELFEPRVDALTLRFLLLLVDNGREDLFPSVVRAYRALRDEQLGLAEVLVRTAQPLGSEEEQRLTTALEAMTEGEVRLQVRVEPELIGGLVIRVGDTVYDGSVRHQLATLREQLEHGTFAVGPQNGRAASEAGGAGVY